MKSFRKTLFAVSGFAFALCINCAKPYPGEPEAALTLLTSQIASAGLIVTPITGRTSEWGGAAGFYVSLRTQPTSTVIVGPITVGSGEASVFSGQVLTFTTSNWSTGQLVAIIGNDDFVVDGSVAYNVTVGPITSQDALYAGISPIVLSTYNDDNDRFLFVTTNPVANGGLGGIAGADATCNGDPGKAAGPSGAVYAAMLVDPTGAACAGANRCASNSSNTGLGQTANWVFKNPYHYVRAGEVRVIVPNAVNLFNFGGGAAGPPAACGSSAIAGAFSSSVGNVWTGLLCDWTAYFDTCVQWTNNTGAFFSISGNKNVTDQTALNTAISTCNTPGFYLVCVQQ